MSLNSRIMMFVEKSVLDMGFANCKRELFRGNNCQSASSLHDSEFVQNHNMGNADCSKFI